ncbi:TspO/MBR family protein [Psychrobacillus lasiicapitis]|uniref:Tryptophan-rich sensory protein n=1 Tax=Psychrobacillus lasiicapitis TaxID=1636719 RepID=A0A544SX46_9BACI|nr:TspO/MBR family protein [Psychrobacillus lasiicapitis]TQR09711.1 tryptophan-rich sensory protein [Psychrobacillus lasiicapitis]GGA22887.1 tryptophan-rich sensory protein [Psychrobacillus lasiicapitis]
MELLKVDGRLNKKRLALSILIPVVGGSITGWLANRNAQSKYKKLKQPSFAPPAAIFPIVWTSLYTIMGIAKYRATEKVKHAKENTPAIPLYELQLGLNFLWSFLFFRWGLRGTALIEMVTMLALIALTAYEFQKVDKTAGVLMMPYIGWVTFALGLNYAVWKLNK